MTDPPLHAAHGPQLGDSAPGDEPAASPASPEETIGLVRRIQRGDRAAMGELAERYYPRIRRIVRIRFGDRMKGSTGLDDLVQEVLLRVLRGVETFEERSGAMFIHWVSRLASNTIVDEARRRARRVGTLAPWCLISAWFHNDRCKLYELRKNLEILGKPRKNKEKPRKTKEIQGKAKEQLRKSKKNLYSTSFL